MKTVTHLKVKPGRQSLENGLACTFQATGNILLYKTAEPAVPQNFCVDILIRSTSNVTVFGERVFCFVCLFSIFWLHHEACGILVPLPGIELTNPAVDRQGSPGERVLKEVMKVK